MADRMNTAEALMEGLLANGIRTIYALPGVQNDPFFDAMYHAQNRLRVLHTRHEQGTGYMALGAAMATGEPQAMCVVPGPGMLNAASALATAYSNNAPVMAVVGQIPLHTIGRQMGQLHEIVRQTDVLATMAKWNAVVKGPTEVAPLVAQAFQQLRTPRVRPVALEVPMDIWQRKAAVAPHVLAAGLPAPPLDEDAIEDAAKLLGTAERPIILVGGGALEASAEVTALAEALGAPVMSFRMGRGVVSSHNPLDIRLPVGHKLWPEVDVVLALGTRGQQPFGSWGVDANMKVIRVDADPEEMTRFGLPHLGIEGHVKPVAAALLDKVAGHNRKRAAWTERVASAKAEVMGAMRDRLAPQMAFLDVIRQELPDDGTFVDELTQVGYVSRIALPVYKPRGFISTGLQGTLGWGFATGLGVASAKPGVPVVGVNGDGGFMFTVQEIATAVQHRIPLTAIVFNDGAYGNVKGFQKQNFGGRTIASDLKNPDFVKLAEAFGAQGLRVHSPEELRGALKRGFATTDGPTIIDVPVAESPSPWGFIQLPKVRGK